MYQSAVQKCIILMNYTVFLSDYNPSIMCCKWIDFYDGSMLSFL